MTLFGVFSFYSFMMGAFIASFLNVVIWRVPRGESIVTPPSHCPKCNSRIRWWQNIPIVSWLALRGKCAKCRAPISPRYILIETLGGMLFLATFWHLFPVGAAISAYAVSDLIVWWIWIALMIVGTFIDFDHQLLPDFVTVGGMVLGIIAAAANLAIFISTTQIATPDWWDYSRGFIMSIVGLLTGFGMMWLIRALGTKAFKREAMGLGDVFLMGAIGAIFGPIATIFCLMVSAILGSIVGLGMILLSKAKLGKFVAIPYGPYICMACLVWMFRGPQIVLWYLSLFRATP